MNLNLALCLTTPPSKAADVQGALFHLEMTWFATCPEPHLPWYKQDNLLSPERAEAAGDKGILSICQIRVC